MVPHFYKPYNIRRRNDVWEGLWWARVQRRYSVVEDAWGVKTSYLIACSIILRLASLPRSIPIE